MEKMRNKPTEAALWRRIRNVFNTDIARAYRVEAIATPGFPDVVWVHMGDVKLIELKAGPLKLRQSQIQFMRDCAKRTVTVWVIWQKEVGGQILVFPGNELAEMQNPPGKPFETWIVEMQTND